LGQRPDYSGYNWVGNKKGPLMVQILLNLPEELAEQAAAAGILDDDKMRALISAEVERQAKISRLFDSMKKLQQTNTLSQEEIDAEIEASRV
jgi:hypothetical protein